jgi:hypothetical protein
MQTILTIFLLNHQYQALIQTILTIFLQNQLQKAITIAAAVIKIFFLLLQLHNVKIFSKIKAKILLNLKNKRKTYN